MEVVGIFIFFIIVAIAGRLIAGGFDGGRVEQYVRDQGWTLVDKSWAPFGPGWFGEKSDRIYEIVFEDQEGNTHRAHVKTSLFTGVYLTNDTIVAYGNGQEDLVSENERLKRRIAELEGRA